MESPNLDLETRAYIKSESEFNYARMKAFLEIIMGAITGHNMHLLSFTEVRHKLRLKQSIYQGLQDIPLENIVGSTGRYEDFTRHFLPRNRDQRNKERWRNIYTLAVTGKGFPPIDVYKVDQVYFVKDGNHRVSVARELGWETIQAYVTELPTPVSLQPEVEPDELLIKEEAAYFLEQTQLDKTRPDAKQHIDFTEPGGYPMLLKHIELHRYSMARTGAQLTHGETLHPLRQAPFDRLRTQLRQAQEEPQDTASIHYATLRQAQEEPQDAGLTIEASSISLVEAAADWYDNIYLPMIRIVREMAVIGHFPGRSETDLYRWLIQHQAELRQQHDLEQLEMPEAVQEFLEAVE